MPLTPVRVVVITTMGIYSYTGYTIFIRRRALREFTSNPRASKTERVPPLVIANPFTADISNITKRTEITVKYSDTIGSETTVVENRSTNDSRSSFSSTRGLSSVPAVVANPALPRYSRTNRDSSQAESGITSYVGNERDGIQTTDVVAEKRNPYEGVDTSRSDSLTYDPNARRNLTIEGNTAAWSYFKVAFLMFAALVIVWVPSTVNRLQSFISKDNPIFGLNLASALVLPLQGFWNMMVYISTTWPECKRASREIMDAIAAAKHPDKLRILHSRKDSDHTLTAKDNRDFNSLPVPLNAILKRGPESESRHSDR